MTRPVHTFVLGTLGVALLGGTSWGYLRLNAAREAAGLAATNLAECRRLATKIEAARGPAGLAPGVREPRAEELIRRIEAGAKAAEFPETSIDRIEPGPAQRVGDGPLREKPTVVHLRGVTLRQVFTFLHGVSSGRSGLSLKQIRLSAPSPDDAGDRWSVETTLTYLVRPSEGAAALKE